MKLHFSSFRYIINILYKEGEKVIIKTEKELEKMQEIGAICALVLKEMGEAVEAGISTLELDMIGKAAFARYGAVSAPIACYNFPGYTCISVNEVVAHGIPSDKKILKKGDLINIDVSAHKDGYFSDTAYTYSVGEVFGHKKKLMDCSYRARDLAIACAVAGGRLNELGKQVEKEAKRNGFTTIKNLCGHGVGKTLHDEPESIYNYNEKLDRRIIKEGMALAIETFVSERDNYVEDFGDDGWTLVTPNKCQVVQYEHSVMVTDGEPLILTVPNASFLK